jgi:predicted AAA+ superfamily ATPase
MMFIGREQELRFFEDKYSTNGGQLIVLYGRRRIGKTELLHRKRTETTETGKSTLVSYETEIDVMAADRGARNILIGECKFRNSEVTQDDFEKLAEKYRPDKIKISYSLFSKSGFSQGLLEEANKNPAVSLYTHSDILRG